MKKNLYLFWAIIGFSIILLSNCGKKDTTGEDESIQIPVETTVVKRTTVVKELKYTGDIRAEHEVRIFSKIPDRILSFEKDEGDDVAKGDVIAVIEATKIENAVAQAKAAVANAKAQLANLEAELERSKRLIKEKAISQQQFDAIKTQYKATRALVEQAEAAQAQAENQLADATITSPIAGIIGVRNYEVGDVATGPMPLATVVQMKRVKVLIKVPEQDVGQLQIGQQASIMVESYPDEQFIGTIKRISPIVDPITRMGKVEIRVDNFHKRLKPGMFAEVQVRVETLKDVLVIPKYAIIESTELKRVNGEDVAVVNSKVFVEKDGIAHLQNVEISYTNGVVAVVSSGVDEGDHIVVVGQQSLKDGARVKVLEKGVY